MIVGYQFKYNGQCISGCPDNTHVNADNPYKCIDNLNCELSDKYYNYEGIECIDKVPEGFYCNNPTEKTIAPFHSNCKTCDEGPTDNNNNCKACKDSGTIYFDLGNCLENCALFILIIQL